MSVNSLGALRRSLFLVSMPMVFITFALPLRAEDLGATGFEIGILFSLFTGSVFVLRPLVGFGLDWFGRRPFFIAAMLFYFAANIAYALSGSLETLYAARLVQGIGFATLSITTATITADLTQRDSRAEAMGGNIASQARGGMVGAFVGFGLVGAIPLHAWVYSFSTYTVVALLAVLFAFRIIPETGIADRQTREKSSFKFPAKHYRLLVIIFLAAFAGAVIDPYYLIYLRERFDLELYWLAFAFLPIGLSAAILPPFLGRITRSHRRAVIVSIGLFLAGGLYASVPHASSLVWVIVAFTGASIGRVLAELTKDAWIGDISGPDAAGRTFGLAALAAGLGATSGPLAGGLVYDRLGQEYVFYIAAAMMAAAIYLALSFRSAT
jgi:MFS family permease